MLKYSLFLIFFAVFCQAQHLKIPLKTERQSNARIRKLRIFYKTLAEKSGLCRDKKVRSTDVANPLRVALYDAENQQLSAGGKNAKKPAHCEDCGPQICG